jgi:hypothetical protein
MAGTWQQIPEEIPKTQPHKVGIFIKPALAHTRRFYA